MVQHPEIGAANNDRKPVWIVGYMGSGKSTVGKRLASLLDLTFTDSDEWIESRSGKTIAEIFEQEGEASFREWERRFVDELPAERCIIACGGGLPCYNQLMDELLVTGWVIYLEASVTTLVRHLHGEREHRPLLKALTDGELSEVIRLRLEARDPVYRRAHCIVSIDGKAVKQIVEEVVREIRSHTA